MLDAKFEVFVLIFAGVMLALAGYKIAKLFSLRGSIFWKTKAFYFSDKDRRLQHGDGRQIIVGETHSVDGPIELCEHGLHASKRLIDALEYVPGPILYRVELSGEIKHGRDKLAATHRRYLAEFDAGDLLRRFACGHALKHIHLIKPHCSEEDYNAIVDYLRIGSEGLRVRAERVCGELSALFIYKRYPHAVICAFMSAQCAANSYAPNKAIYFSIRSEIALRYERGEKLDYFSSVSLLNNEANDKLTTLVREATGWDI